MRCFSETERQIELNLISLLNGGVDPRADFESGVRFCLAGFATAALVAAFADWPENMNEVRAHSASRRLWPDFPFHQAVSESIDPPVHHQSRRRNVTRLSADSARNPQRISKESKGKLLIRREDAIVNKITCRASRFSTRLGAILSDTTSRSTSSSLPGSHFPSPYS